MNTENANFKELIRVMNERQSVLKNALVEAQDETHTFMLKQSKDMKRH